MTDAPAVTLIPESIFDGEKGSGCLIADGEVVACTGALPGDGSWVEAMSAIGRDADRAARHIGFSAWDAVVIESEYGMIGLAPTPAAAQGAGALAVAACPAGSPPGYVRRVLRRLVPVTGSGLPDGGTMAGRAG